MPPQITIIVPHHLTENEPYLDLCLRSILRSRGIKFELICLSDAEIAPTVPDGVRLIHDRTLINSTRKALKAIEISHPDSELFCFISDDVVVASHSFVRMAMISHTYQCIVNPISNSNNGTDFVAPLVLNGKPMPVMASLEDVKGLEDAIMDYPATCRDLLMCRHWVPFFCTMITRKMWNKVGPLDEPLEVRHGDQDWCFRAAAAGYSSVIDSDSFAFHFGSKTLPKITSEEEYRKATLHFEKKYGTKTSFTD